MCLKCQTHIKKVLTTHVSNNNRQNIDLNVCQCKKTSLILVTRVLGNERRSLFKELFPIRPKTATGRKNRKKENKKAIAKLSPTNIYVMAECYFISVFFMIWGNFKEQFR